MSIVRRLFSHTRPAAEPGRDLAAELARVHDLRRAGILTADEAKAARGRLVTHVEPAHRSAA